MSLNSKYFDVVHSEEKEGNLYTGYCPKNHPMILYSQVDGSPLASLHFLVRNNKEANTLITRRAEEDTDTHASFYGLIDQDDQEFSLVITNLNPEGFINFNILKTDREVKTVNPGGLNEINELKPYQSYEIQCDQSDNKSLILSALKDAMGKETTTVKEDEAQESGPRGTYYCLSVVPQMSCSQLVDKFKKTTWKCSNFLVVKSKPKTPAATPGFTTIPSNQWFNHAPAPMPAYNSPYTGNNTGFGSLLQPRPIGINTVGSRLGSRNLDLRGLPIKPRFTVSPWMNSTYQPDTSTRSFSMELSDNAKGAGATRSAGVTGSLAPTLAPTTAAVPSSTVIPLSTIGSSLKNASYDLRETKIPESNKISLDAEYGVTRGIPNYDLAGGLDDEIEETDTIIDNSWAAEVKGGKTIQVHSIQTGIEYSYDTSSAPCKIGLSVAPNLKMMKGMGKDSLLEEIKAHITALLNQKWDEFLKNHPIYQEDTCCICMEEKPDTIFYQCGHQCVHAECSTDLMKCPFCRTHITGKIEAGKA